MKIGDKILVRVGFTIAKAKIVQIDDRTITWQMKHPPGRSILEGHVLLADVGTEWTEGWSSESFDMLRFLIATDQ